MPRRMRYSLDRLLSECEPQRPRSVEEQAWLGLIPVGREFGAQDKEVRLRADGHRTPHGWLERESRLTPSAQRSARKLSRLNRRQRKKLRVGEFREFLFAVQMRFGVPLDEAAYEDFLDALVRFADSQRLTFGGLGGRTPLTETSAVVSTRTRGSPSEADRQALLEWLQGRCEVESAEVGAFADAWYGNEP